jgi:hypothetical protein
MVQLLCSCTVQVNVTSCAVHAAAAVLQCLCTTPCLLWNTCMLLSSCATEVLVTLLHLLKAFVNQRCRSLSAVNVCTMPAQSRQHSRSICILEVLHHHALQRLRTRVSNTDPWAGITAAVWQRSVNHTLSGKVFALSPFAHASAAYAAPFDAVYALLDCAERTPGGSLAPAALYSSISAGAFSGNAHHHGSSSSTLN